MSQNNETSSENPIEKDTRENNFYHRYPESDSVPASTTANGSTIRSEINDGQNESIERSNTQELHLINFVEQGSNDLQINDQNGDSQINELERVNDFKDYIHNNAMVKRINLLAIANALMLFLRHLVNPQMEVGLYWKWI